METTISDQGAVGNGGGRRNLAYRMSLDRCRYVSRAFIQGLRLLSMRLDELLCQDTAMPLLVIAL